MKLPNHFAVFFHIEVKDSLHGRYVIALKIAVNYIGMEILYDAFEFLAAFGGYRRCEINLMLDVFYSIPFFCFRWEDKSNFRYIFG